tara:strand:- start:105 stop:425 length:321 start_codon:yes stop_codon:yes gene_type:complete
VHHRRRHRTFDVVGASLKGKLTDNEVVYARPPPGYRTYTFRNGMKVPVVWLLKVPLYGEVDAGYIWNRTATHQLCEDTKVEPVGARPRLLLEDPRRWHVHGPPALR